MPNTYAQIDTDQNSVVIDTFRYQCMRDMFKFRLIKIAMCKRSQDNIWYICLDFDRSIYYGDRTAQIETGQDRYVQIDTEEDYIVW